MMTKAIPKTLLVSSCYIDENEKKTRQFLSYYSSEDKMKALGVDKIILLDNSSFSVNLEDLKYAFPKMDFIRFGIHMPRRAHLSYPYWWRTIHFLQYLFDRYSADKIIYMDNDFYALSEQFFAYLKTVIEGWTMFWCPAHKFPETACQVIMKNSADYMNFVDMPLEKFIEKNDNKCAEQVLPVSKVETAFIGDRYGEIGKPVDSTMDYYAQMTPEIKWKRD